MKTQRFLMPRPHDSLPTGGQPTGAASPGMESTDVRLDALSATEWRVCDRRMPETDHLSILGFVELSDGHFEVTRMSSPGDRATFGSLEAARQSFTPFGRAHIQV